MEGLSQVANFPGMPRNAEVLVFVNFVNYIQGNIE
jgi:hypothetical protein